MITRYPNQITVILPFATAILNPSATYTYSSKTEIKSVGLKFRSIVSRRGTESMKSVVGRSRLKLVAPHFEIAPASR